MTRAILAILMGLTLGNSAFASEPYSVRCEDSNLQKVTLFMYPAEPGRIMAAFGQDEEGWPFAVEYKAATLDEVGTLAVPEGFTLMIGGSPDDRGMGVVRYLLLPMTFNPYEFSAFYGSYLIDEPMTLDEKIAIDCF